MPPLHLLELPVDILALILTPLLVQPEPVPLCPCSSHQQDQLLPILLSHPAIHAIAAPLFYKGRTFSLDLTGKHGTHIRRALEEEAAEAQADGDSGNIDGVLGGSREYMYDGMPAMQRRRRDLLCSRDALRRIRCLEVRLDRLRGWIDTLVTPLLTDMVVSGSLAELTITVSGPASQSGEGLRQSTTASSASAPNEHSVQGGNNKSSIFSRPPLAGLIGLLADPYLRIARLWVSSIHSAAWRPFHLRVPEEAYARDCDRLEGRHESTTQGTQQLLERDRVEIDWAAILREMDPEGRRVASFTDHMLTARRRM